MILLALFLKAAANLSPFRPECVIFTRWAVFMSWNFISERAAVLYTGRAASSLQYEEGLAKGLFNPRASMKRKTPCPPGYSRGFLDDDFYMQEQQSKKSAEFDPAMF